MYVDKLDGRIDAPFFDKMSAEWRAEQDRCQREIDRHQEADTSYMDEGVQILELARNAQKLFGRQEPRQKRRTPLCTIELFLGGWRGGRHLPPTVCLLAETIAIAALRKAGDAAISAKSEIWLGRLDSNQG